MLLKLRHFLTGILLLLYPCTSFYAAEATLSPELLPEPLTLDLALQLIDKQHPDLRYVNADLKNSQSDLQQALSSND